MKKLFLVVSSLCLFAFMSCSSIPKNVKDNESLVVGGAVAVLHDYTNFSDLNVNHEFTNGIEITITDVETGKTKLVKPNKDGFFYIKNCTPGSTYEITNFTCRAETENAMMSVGVTFPEPRIFTCENCSVTNLGTMFVDFNGETNEWESVVENYDWPLEYLCAIADDSEWLEAPVVEY